MIQDAGCHVSQAFRYFTSGQAGRASQKLQKTSECIQAVIAVKRYIERYYIKAIRDLLVFTALRFHHVRYV